MPRGGRTEKWPSAAKAEALGIAAERGAEAAAQETGISVSTIRSWRTKMASKNSAMHVRTAAGSGGRLQNSGTPTKAWVGARETQSAAQKAHKRLERALRSGSTLDAQRLSISLGVLLDKSAMLTRQAAEQETRQVVVEGEKVERLRSVIGLVFGALEVDVSPGSPAAGLLGGLLRQLADGDDVLVADQALAAQARAALRQRVEEGIRERLVAEIFERIAPVPTESPQLAPQTTERPSEPMVPPVKTWRPTLPEARVAAANARRAKSVADQVAARRGYGTSEFS